MFQTPQMKQKKMYVWKFLWGGWKTLSLKINETDMNIRKPYTWDKCTWLHHTPNASCATCWCRLQFFGDFSSSAGEGEKGRNIFRKKKIQTEMAFRKILIAFARSTRCRNNENYDKLRNL